MVTATASGAPFPTGTGIATGIATGILPMGTGTAAPFPMATGV